jgi:protein TonB
MLSNKETLKRQGDLLVSLVSPDKLFSKPQAAPRQDIHYGQSPPPAGAIIRKQIPVEKGIIRDDLSPKTGTPKESVEDRPKESSGVPATPPPAITKKAEEPPSKPAIRTPSMREKLFDRTIIGDLAKRDIEHEAKKEEKAFTLDTKEYRFLVYNKRLKERIETIWIYPQDAASQGIYGDLVIRFTIKKNGMLGAVELVRTSGHRGLDAAAMKALKDAEPLWPLPDEWSMDAYTIEGHFIYTLYGTYIR